MRDLPTDVILRAIVGQIASYVVTRLLLAPDGSWDDAREAAQIMDLIMHGIVSGARDAETQASGGCEGPAIHPTEGPCCAVSWLQCSIVPGWLYCHSSPYESARKTHKRLLSAGHPEIAQSAG